MQLEISSTARRKTIYSVIAGGILFLLSFLLVPETLPSNSSATPGVEAIPTLAISGSHSLNLTVGPGQFGTSDSQNLVVETTNYTGYTMTIAPSTGESTDLVNTALNTATIPSIANTTTAADFENLNSAAYGLSIDEGTNYFPVTSGATINTTSGPTDSTTGALTLKLGAKTQSDTPAGTYAKSFTLTAVANTAAYDITFDANADTDTVYNMPLASAATLSGLELTLPFDPAPNRRGYSFLGWDTNQNATIPQYTSSNNILEIDPADDNSIILYAIWGCHDGYICYYDNGADAGQGTMKQNNFQSDRYYINGSVTLVAPNYSKTGYGFVGWSETQVSPDQPIADIKAQIAELAGEGKIYGPNESITMPYSQAPLELYAVWLPAEKDANNQPVYLQGWAGCSAMSANEVKVLTDSRDNNVYTITKIVDSTTNYSECWMTENLRIDAASSDVVIDNSNTNYPASSFLAQKDAFSGDTWQACGQNNSATCINQIAYNLDNIDRDNTASHNAEGVNQVSSWYAYGGAYNWFTATAGNGLYGKASGSAVGDICPSGWRLPIGNTGGDYAKLDNALANSLQGVTTVDKRWRAYPTNTVLSGYYSYPYATSRGNHARYQTSTSYETSNVYAMLISEGSVIPGTRKDYGRTTGHTIRCLSGNPNYYIIYNSNGGTGYGDPQSLGSTAPNGNTGFDLVASNFRRADYGFAGWSTEPLDPTSSDFAAKLATAVSQNKVYGPNAQIKPSASDFDIDKNITLYAIWVPVEKDGNNEELTFQSFNPEAAPYVSRGNGDVIALRDTRDNQVYAVAKLADGNYWMIENLRLDLSDVNTTITASNTNHPTQELVDDIAGGYKGNPDATKWKNCTLATSDCSEQISFSTNNFEQLSTSPSYNYQAYSWYSYGVLYNWYTATGGHGDYNKSSGQVDGDLCSFGWHLPTGGSTTAHEFYNLNYKLNGNRNVTNSTASVNIRAFPNNYIYSGAYHGDTATYRGTGGIYWSSTSYSNSSPIGLLFTSSSVSPGYSLIAKREGGAIRCSANITRTFALNYDANGGVNAPSQQSATTRENSLDFTIDSAEPTLEGFAFAGWSMDKDASEAQYQPGQTYTFYQSAVTLYAVWVPEIVIRFNAEGASGNMDDQGIPSGTTKMLRKNTFQKYDSAGRDYYRFIGWATQGGSTAVAFTDEASYTAPTVNSNTLIDLYAIWGRKRTVTYDINNGDVGNMSSYTTYEYDTFTLHAPNFSRQGYGFVGWSLDKDAQPGNGSVIYGPNETILVPGYGEGNSRLTIYAIWLESESGVTMQTFDPSVLAYAERPIDSVIALNDSRDTNTYAVAKLADGNWWMVENLRLDPAGKTLNATNTNNPNSSFASTVSALQSSSFANCTTANQSCIERYSVGLGNLNGNTDAVASNGQSYRWRAYGAMYNWYTATAGQGTYSETGNNGAITGDICPAGWHLPYGGDGDNVSGGNTAGGIYNLNYKLNNNSNVIDDDTLLRKYPTNFVYSGYYTGSSASYRNSRGAYWSSTADGSRSADILEIRKNYARPGTDSYSKYGGLAVRCVAFARYNLSISLGTGVDSIEVDGVSYASSTTISLSENSTHTISMTPASGYEFDSWSVSDTGASVASTSTQSTTFTMGTDAATLTANAKVIVIETTLDTGSNINVKLKALAGASNPDINTTNNNITSFQRASTLPSDLTSCDANTPASRVISTSSSTSPVCISFDSNTGTMYYYTEASTIYANNDSKHMFKNLSVLSSAPGLAGWDTSRVANMSSMFSGAGANASSFSIDLSSWDASQVTSMIAMFENAGENASTVSINLSGWNIAAATYIDAHTDNMFDGTGYGATSLTIDLSGWDTSSVSSMDDMFYGAGRNATTWIVTIPSTNGGGINNDTTHLYGSNSSTYAEPASGKTFTLAATNNNNNGNNNNNTNNSPSQNQQSAPQSAPRATPAALPQSTNEPTNNEDQTDKETDSEATNTPPLGVKRSSDETNPAETVATTKSGTMSESDGFGIIALVGAGVAATSGLLLLFGKRRKEDEEEEEQ